MTYAAGSLIEATDYNTYANTGSPNLNQITSVGSGNTGWGEAALSSASSGGSVLASDWANLVNRISSAASQTGVAITARTPPVTGNPIVVLANIATDLTSIYNSRGNATVIGNVFTAWTGTSGKITSTAQGANIAFTHTVTFASANAARYFFNAGGLVRIQFNKTSTGATGDSSWNALAGNLCGAVWISGRSTSANATVAGTVYSGSTVIGGTGTPATPTGTLYGTSGWFQLTTANAVIYKQFSNSAPYTNNYIQVSAKTGNAGATLDISTLWYNDAAANGAMSGGTAPSGGSFGTAPATIVTYYPPSTTYLPGAAWGTPTVTATVA